MITLRSHGTALGLAALSLAAASLALAADTRSDPAVEQAFLAENDADMGRMMTGMRVKPTGDIDRDFVDMMVPHHQGAIDMAMAELRYGRNRTILRMAQEIIVTQQEEIATMRRAVGEPAPPSAPAPTQLPSRATMRGLMMK
jgi:uncharacterized protein (DUF305 family)